VTSQLHRQRRRGEELEAALLDAAWEELVDVGFARLTMESVAARAKTGVAVLYRRWPNKHDLVIAAIRHYGDTHPVAQPDTGSLRGDMIALLSSVSEERQPFTAVVTATFAGLLASSGLTPAEVRERIVAFGARLSVAVVNGPAATVVSRKSTPWRLTSSRTRPSSSNMSDPRGSA